MKTYEVRPFNGQFYVVNRSKKLVQSVWASYAKACGVARDLNKHMEKALGKKISRVVFEMRKKNA